MKILFVDAENIGARAVDNIDASVLDKVFVFSNDVSVKKYCEQVLYFCLSGYPQCSNQADFYMIAYLSKTLCQLSKKEKSQVNIVLYSKDSSLIKAFQFHCDLVGVKCTVFSAEVGQSNIVSICDPKSGEHQMLALLKSPKSSAELKKSLNLSQAEFTRVINVLIKEKRICRDANKSKLWMKVSCV